MTHGSLFSGIGGFDLAAEWLGWENKFHCEWNPFGQRVLKYYWPNAELFNDITQSNFTKYNGTIDVVSGGFPCQPYSMAGQRKGKNDERHLWPYMFRAIQEISPRFIVGENVRGLTNWNGGLVFDEVCIDIENIGYQVAPFIIPASAVNAPHQRERVFFIATNTDGHGFNKCDGKDEINASERGFDALNDIEQIPVDTERIGRNEVTNENGKFETSQQKKRGKKQFSGTNCPFDWWRKFPIESPVCSGNDGFPSELDGITFSNWRKESIKAYGNAVVPQVIYQIFKAIELFDIMNSKQQ